MDPWARRLNEALGDTDWSAAELARQSGVPTARVYKYLDGKVSRPRGRAQDDLADALNVNNLWLRDGIGPKSGRQTGDNDTTEHLGDTPDQPEVTSEARSRYVEVMTAEVRLGLGGGGAGEDDFIGEPQLMPVSLIEGELRGHGSDFLLYDVQGGSMSPDLLSGDRVLIDRRKTNPSEPGIFALFDGFGLVAKLVERVARSDPPQIRILSRDPDLTPHEATLDEVRIIGRVVWYARRI